MSQAALRCLGSNASTAAASCCTAMAPLMRQSFLAPLGLVAAPFCTPARISPPPQSVAYSSSTVAAQRDEAPGPGPGPRTRSMDQAAATGETSTTSGPDSKPARSPDALADPAELAGNRGSDPDRVIRTAAWQADQAMSSSYQNHPGPDTGGSHLRQAPSMAGRLAEKVAGAADVAAQAAIGAVSAMSQTVKAATGSATGITGDHNQSPLSRGSPADPKDQSPVSDNATVEQLERASRGGGQQWDQMVPDTNSDTAGPGEIDTAGGTADPEMLQRKTEQGGYRQAAERLMDIEGLPRKS